MRKQKLREVKVTFLNDLIYLQVAKIGSKSHLSDSKSYIFPFSTVTQISL